MRNLTFKQYRNIDLFLFAVMLTVSEAVCTIATNKWFAGGAIAVHSTLVFVCIIMMRWNWFAVIHACLGGLVFCITSIFTGFTDEHIVEQLLVYVLGNCFALLALLWFKVFKKEDVRKDLLKLILFVLSAYVMTEVGRCIVSLCFGRGIDVILAFFSSDIISVLFALVIMIFLRGVDGMIEDQKAYLFRIQREAKAQQEQNFSGGYGSEE